MAKKEASAPNKKRKGSKAITVFNVIFIVLLVIAAVVGVLMFTPVAHSIKEFLKNQAWLADFAPKYIGWVKYHLVQNLGLTMPFRGHSEAFSTVFYGFMYLGLLLALLFLCYTPFLVMNHNRKLGRKGGFRKALCWITFVVSFLVFIGYLSVPYTQKITSLVGKAYSWFPETYAKWTQLFVEGHPLSSLKLEFISPNPWFNATFYILVMLVLLQIIFYILACKIKANERFVEDEKEVKVEESAVEAVPAAAEETPVVVAAAEVKPEEKPAVEFKRVAPTIRELAIINSLEPIEASPVSNLPGLYDTEVEKLIELLEPQTNEELAHEDKVSPDAIEARRLSETIQPNMIRAINVLPGIDEWGATPWHEETVVKPRDYTVKVLPGIDEFQADPWAEEKIEEKPAIENVEVKPEEPIETPVVEETSEVNDITDIVTPEENPVPVVEDIAKEEVVEDRSENKVVLLDNSREEVKTETLNDNEWAVPEYNPEEDKKEEEPVIEEEKPVEEPVVEEPVVEEKKGPVTKAINFIEDDGKRPQEEEHEPVVKESSESRIDQKEVVLDNSHEDIKTEKFTGNAEWIVPEYVPEAKPAVQPVVKPVANVKQVELKAPVFNKENKPKISPIAPVTPEPEPIVEEEKPVEKEKVLTPIAGPLHSTAKSKHEKIEVVKAQKVRFELKNYQIKTYQGDLTAEEAFMKGVTKVQPTVNPVFANQSNEPEWKQKRRNEDIRKNGYTNVTTIDKLNGNVAPAPMAAPTKGATSIRELVKAQKANNEAANEAAEKKDDENKIAKPTAPISFKPVEPVKPVEPTNDKIKAQNPFSDKEVPAFHPIAPINKKPSNRPVIKPVDPIKKK